MHGDICSKNFPKKFTSVTVDRNDGYPEYMRRDNGRTVRLRRRSGYFTFDNSWVVPYNPWLCLKYNAHINVEICNSVAAVKYLYKYVYKGHDRAMISVEADAAQSTDIDRPAPVSDIDEIQQYLDARYVSASECCWRLLSFAINNQYPTVLRLAIHLPNMQSIIYRDGDNLRDAIDRSSDTTLMAWFKLNQRDEQARSITYQDIPSLYTWSISQRRWERRRNNASIIGRISFVQPNDSERFALRALLLRVPGCMSYEQLRTFDGIVYETFHQAALARRLLADDNEYDNCLSEASNSRSPRQLRRLFVTLLLFCNPSSPADLWRKFAQSLSEDYEYRLQQRRSDSNAQLLALRDIDRILQSNGKSLADFRSLPQLSTGFDATDDFAWLDDLDAADASRDAISDAERLNADQRRVFDAVERAVEDPMAPSKLFFVDGPAGTGKSFLYNTIIGHVRGTLNKHVLVVASSGIAALLLNGGITAHSAFKIPLDIQPNSTCSFSTQSKTAQSIREASLLIWDEAPMSHRHIFEAVDRSFRDILDTEQPFGGLPVVLGGDFRQILPVVPRGSQAQVEDASLKRSSAIWPRVTVMKLTDNMRVKDDANAAEFAEFLLEVGEGRVPTRTFSGDNDYIRLPDQMLLAATATDPLDRLITRVYGDLHSKWQDRPYIFGRAILAAKNADVNEINRLATDRFPGTEIIYLSQDTVLDPHTAAVYPTEFLNSLDITGMPPHRLALKVGQPIILLRNIDPAQGLCNGTRLICVRLSAYILQAEIPLGRRAGSRVFIPRIPLHTPDNDRFPIQFCRRQYPVRPAFALTVNKSQGQTLESLGLYLPQPLFTHGQLYVALSWCKNRDQIFILIPNGSFGSECGSFTRNIVYKQVLQ